MMMLHSAKELKGFSLAAIDGELGHVEDSFFDDAKWTIRHLAVDTGGWLSGRNVLISPLSVQRVDWDDKTMRVNLTRQQIQDSPGIDTAKPISRQHEIDLYGHYGYPYYWTGPYLWGYTMFPVFFEKRPLEDPARQELRQEIENEGRDPHLRSSKEVIGYHVQATDDAIGHIEDFLFEERDWSIQLVVVDTRNRWPGKHVLLSPQRIREVDWPEGKVLVDVTREQVENSPEYDSMNPPASGAQHDLYRHFGRPPQRP
jgi:uncharacterized protein YrrD